MMHLIPARLARRPRALLTRRSPGYRPPRVRELPMRLELVAPGTFGGLVSDRTGAPLAVAASRGLIRGAVHQPREDGLS